MVRSRPVLLGHCAHGEGTCSPTATPASSAGGRLFGRSPRYGPAGRAYARRGRPPRGARRATRPAALQGPHLAAVRGVGSPFHMTVSPDPAVTPVRRPGRPMDAQPPAPARRAGTGGWRPRQGRVTEPPPAPAAGESGTPSRRGGVVREADGVSRRHRCVGGIHCGARASGAQCPPPRVWGSERPERRVGPALPPRWFARHGDRPPRRVDRALLEAHSPRPTAFAPGRLWAPMRRPSG